MALTQVDGNLLASGGVTPTQLNTQAQYTGFKNRLINGSMTIDQRNAGASVTPASGEYTLDRWETVIAQSSKFTLQQNAGSVTPPTGFVNYLGVTSSSSYAVVSGDYFNIVQPIEGLNVADLGWGTASASSVTLSFWVRSSLTGTFAGALRNNGVTRSYPFAYTISAANTWEQKSVTIAGDTTGTWLKTNGVGIYLSFSLGAGSTFSGTAGAWASGNYPSATGSTNVVSTNGATFYITGVQLEKGSTATSFDYRPYGTELALCQRYYEKSYDIDIAPATVTANGCLQYNEVTSSSYFFSIPFAVSKRIQGVTVTWYNPSTGASGSSRDISANADRTTTTDNVGMSRVTCAVSGGTAGNILRTHYTASAEL